jgi:hypothetical protein
VAEANIDRTELSLSVHPVVGNRYPEDRQQLLLELLANGLPRALSYNHNFAWKEFAEGLWKGRGTGVIYCIYAKPQGQTSWRDGVGAVHDALLEHEVIREENLRIYAGNSPYYCPICFQEGNQVYSIRRSPGKKEDEDEDTDEGSYECLRGHRFPRPAVHDDWITYTSQTQYDFKDKTFPLLNLH